MTGQLTCLACGSADSAGLFNAKDHMVSKSEYLIRRCNACGMGWTANPPAEPESGAYYVSEDYISHTDRKQSLPDKLYHLARSFMLRRKQRMVTLATGKNNGNLVDIGSGTGYFAAFMKKKGWQVTAIEISETARKYSENQFGLKAISPEEINHLPSGSADCITFWHVLEHLYDPAEWFNNVARVLKDDGKCILALPNFSSSDALWFGKWWAALDVPRHLWHFTPEALRLFAGRNGFTCERIASLPLDLFYISILSYRNKGIPMPLLRGVMTGMFLGIRSGFRKQRSSSLVYILSKNKLT